MESRNEIPIGKENLRRVTSAFKNKLTTEFEEPLATILEQHKDGLKPLTGYYVSAKKGKKQLSKKIAKDATSKLLEVFAADFIHKTINSPFLDETLKIVDESIETKGNNLTINLPESKNALSDHGMGFGIDSKGNPKFNLDIHNFKENYFVKFIIRGIPPKSFSQKMIFKIKFDGGFYDTIILNVLRNNRSLQLGELGGELLVYVIKLPFIKQEFELPMYDNFTAIPLPDVNIPITNLPIKLA